MKKIMSLLLCATVFNCYANTIVTTNSPNCFSLPDDDLNTCFQNKTGATLSRFALLESKTFTNGSVLRSIMNLSANQPNHYISVTSSKEDMQKMNIASVEYSIVRGDAAKSRTIDGCVVRFNSMESQRAMLVVQKTGSHYSCA